MHTINKLLMSMWKMGLLSLYSQTLRYNYSLVLYPSLFWLSKFQFDLLEDFVVALHQVGDEVTVLDATGKYVMPG